MRAFHLETIHFSEIKVVLEGCSKVSRYYFMTQGGLDKNLIFSMSKPSKIPFLSETLSYTDP